MQGQYGSATDRRLSRVFWDTWNAHGFRKGVMRGYWVTVAREIPAYGAFVSPPLSFLITSFVLICHTDFIRLLSSLNAAIRKDTEKIFQYGLFFHLGH